MIKPAFCNAKTKPQVISTFITALPRNFVIVRLSSVSKPFNIVCDTLFLTSELCNAFQNVVKNHNKFNIEFESITCFTPLI